MTSPFDDPRDEEEAAAIMAGYRVVRFGRVRQYSPVTRPAVGVVESAASEAKGPRSVEQSGPACPVPAPKGVMPAPSTQGLRAVGSALNGSSQSPQVPKAPSAPSRRSDEDDRAEVGYERWLDRIGGTL